MAFKYLTDEEEDALSMDERMAYLDALCEHRAKFPLVRTTRKFMRLRDPKTGETMEYSYRIAEFADGLTNDNHDFRSSAPINAYVRHQMMEEGKIHPYASDGEVHSALTANIPDSLLQEYCDRCDALFARFTIDEPTGQPDVVREYPRTPKEKKPECK